MLHFILGSLSVALSSPAGWEVAELVPVPVPEPSALAMSYYRSGIVLWIFGHLWSLLIPLLILFSGFSGRIRDLARRIGRNRFGTIAVYFVLYLTLAALLDLPFDFYAGYVRSHAYGLSRQSLGRWFEERMIGLGVSLALVVLLGWIPFLVITRSPKRWWLYTGLLVLPFMLFGAMIKPIWIDPLFNTFTPMENKILEAKILALADRAGIEGSRVFQVDKSRDTKTVNAYVTGFLGTKRIVLWDTLLDRATDKEILAVMGHEMGHYVLNHVAWGVALATPGSIIILYLIHILSLFMIKRFSHRFGFDRLSDIASLPLLLVLISAINLVGDPIRLGVSRFMEHEADRFSLEVTRGNHSAASAFAKLQAENLANPRPDPLLVFWRSSHPPIGERIDFCNSYHPWTEGRAGRYETLFRPERASKP